MNTYMVGTKLICTKNYFMWNKDKSYTKGKTYIITGEVYDEYAPYIVPDDNDEGKPMSHRISFECLEEYFKINEKKKKVKSANEELIRKIERSLEQAYEDAKRSASLGNKDLAISSSKNIKKAYNTFIELKKRLNETH